jgi:hypothetical protein
MTNVVPLRRVAPSYGIVHVLPLDGGGFEVAHESASGNSWGNFTGPFARAEEAVAAANALNRATYAGACEVHVCADARRDAEEF